MRRPPPPRCAPPAKPTANRWTRTPPSRSRLRARPSIPQRRSWSSPPPMAAKFPEAVQAATGVVPALPAKVGDLVRPARTVRSSPRRRRGGEGLRQKVRIRVTPNIHTLSNGVRVVCDPIGGLESLALSIVIDGGARWETEAAAGWAHLLEHMVFKGAGARSSREIVEAIEGEGGHINAATGQERTSFQVRCLTGGLPLGLEVLTDLIRRPTLDAADLEKEKGGGGAGDRRGRRYAGRPGVRTGPGPRLRRKPPGAPDPRRAGQPRAGHAGGAIRLSTQGLYAADRIVVSAAGAVDEDELLALTEAAFGDARAPAQPLARPEAATFAGGHASETRKLEQAHVVLMLPGLVAARSGLFRPGAVHRNPRRRHVVPPVPRGAGGARPSPTPSTPTTRVTRISALSASTPAPARRTRPRRRG